MGARALQSVVRSSTAQARLAEGVVFELDNGPMEAEPGLDIIPTGYFRSAATLIADVSQGRLAARTKAVLFDPEHWRFTPVAEQHDLVGETEAAEKAAHAHHLLFIVAPGTDLASVLAPGRRQSSWQTLLHLGTLGALAAHADVLNVQAQSLERDPSHFAAFVRQAVNQAKASNPSVVVLAGVSTARAGSGGAGSIEAAMRAARSLVSGWWMNIPTSGPSCLSCRAPKPGVAIQAVSDGSTATANSARQGGAR